MDILSALKTEASKLQQQLDGLNSAIKALGGRNNLGGKSVMSRRLQGRKWHGRNGRGGRK